MPSFLSGLAIKLIYIKRIIKGKIMDQRHSRFSLGTLLGM